MYNISQRSSLLIVCLPKATAVIYYSLNVLQLQSFTDIVWLKRNLQFQIKTTALDMPRERAREEFASIKKTKCIKKKNNIKHALYFSSSSSCFVSFFYVHFMHLQYSSIPYIHTICIIIKLLRFLKYGHEPQSYERLSSHG